MKQGIHPDYKEANVHCSCGEVFTTRSTTSKINVEICSKCHPFYTGKQKFVDTGGRVERFQKKFDSVRKEIEQKEQKAQELREQARKQEEEAQKAASEKASEETAPEEVKEEAAEEKPSEKPVEESTEESAEDTEKQ